MNEEEFKELYKNVKKEQIIEELYYKCEANKELYIGYERLNNIINEIKNGIKELDDMFYETFRISCNGYYSISEWELKEFTDKLKELKENK